LRHEPSFERLRVQVKNIAGLLQDQASIPMIQAELPLILDL
jgi:type I restriction enzyme R subunit